MNDPKQAKLQDEKDRKFSRWFIIAFAAILAVVTAISLTTNLDRMWNKWEDSKDSGVHGSGPSGRGGARLDQLQIVSGDRRHIVKVELVRTDADRARGLMFRQSMPQDQGMLFDFEHEQMVSMWMKNTYIPLDMVFIASDGRIHRIEHRAEPESERTISSGAPVRSVLELNGGVAARLGLRAGDRVVHPIFR